MTKQFSTPGPRAIHPELCDSPSLGRCGVLANALFPRLIALADDQGRLQGGAQRVLVMALGNLLHAVRVDEVAAALDELEQAGHLQRYQDGETDLLQLMSWWRWQGSMRRAYPSRWPAPKGWQDLVYGTSNDVPATIDIAASQGSRHNAAIRGTKLQSASSRAAPRAGARAGSRARGVPDRAVPEGKNAGALAANGAAARPGPARVGEVISEFAQRVPRPGGDG